MSLILIRGFWLPIEIVKQPQGRVSRECTYRGLRQTRFAASLAKDSLCCSGWCARHCGPCSSLDLNTGIYEWIRWNERKKLPLNQSPRWTSKWASRTGQCSHTHNTPRPLLGLQTSPLCQAFIWTLRFRTQVLGTVWWALPPLVCLNSYICFPNSVLIFLSY